MSNLHTSVTILSADYTECNKRNGPDFGRVFLMLNYNEKPQNTYIQSSMVTEIRPEKSVDFFGVCVLYSVTSYSSTFIAVLRYR